MLAHTVAYVFVTAAVLLATDPSCFGGDGAAPGEQDAKTTSRQIVDGYRANRDSFGAFTCRFTYKTGQAASLDDAKNGKIESTLEGDGLWIVDGPRTRYRFVTTMVKPGKLAAPVVKRGPGGKTVTVVETAGAEESYLETQNLVARQSGRVIKLSPPRAKAAMPDITPFNLNAIGDLTVLEQTLGGLDSAHVDGTIEESGQSLFALSCGRDGRPMRLIYRVDPKRGYLPVHFWYVDPNSGKWKFEAFILELKDCGSGRWFPIRGLVVGGAKDDPWPRSVRELHVTELKLEHPDDQEFALDVPAKTRIFNSVSRKRTTVETKTRLHESQLMSLFAAPPAN